MWQNIRYFFLALYGVCEAANLFSIFELAPHMVPASFFMMDILFKGIALNLMICVFQVSLLLKKFGFSQTGSALWSRVTFDVSVQCIAY